MKNSAQIIRQLSSAFEALDALDVAFASNFGTEGLEASECIQQAMSMIERVEEVANGIPDDRLPKTMTASFWITDDLRVTSQHCWAVVASTTTGTYCHYRHFSDKAKAEDLLARCNAAGRINLIETCKYGNRSWHRKWNSCEL